MVQSTSHLFSSNQKSFSSSNKSFDEVEEEFMPQQLVHGLDYNFCLSQSRVEIIIEI